MKRNAMAAALLTFSLVLAGCETTRAVVPVRPDKTNPERFVCEPTGSRPTIPPEHVIDWTKVRTVPEAKVEHDAYVRTVRTREGVVAGYIVQVEGRLFVCSNNVEWLRDFFAGLPD